jgi:hypothetical protein
VHRQHRQWARLLVRGFSKWADGVGHERDDACMSRASMHLSYGDLLIQKSFLRSMPNWAFLHDKDHEHGTTVNDEDLRR